MDHRLQLIDLWGITPGSRILEIGCGQGDCTTALADAVGENGHVDALDPGAPDYGAPYTLAQAHAHLQAGPLGPRITFHNTDPVTYLSSLPPSFEPYDYVVLSHCIWYFESPGTLSTIISSLAGRTRYLCLAEWSLRASTPSTLPHVITALLLASVEAKRNIPGSGNIRTILSPAQIFQAVRDTGKFESRKEKLGASGEALKDGYWEVSDTLREREKVLDELKKEGVGEKEIGALVAMYESVQAGVDILGDVKDVKTMDWWAGLFKAI
ncbi:S-adenosyl-L-methionine-dependent methyltransferase [Bisporella sp. PMI_857]|nr:S-adenosyl-L-methionine-dependent methyltransferase [Bisporella sp. PMI_857]